MTPGARLQTACQTLGWSARALAERLSCSPRLVQRWWADEPGYAVPELVISWAETLAAFVQATPAPAWGKRRS